MAGLTTILTDYVVQQKRDDSRVPKYVLESRKGGLTEVVRGYTTSNYTNYSERAVSVSTTSPTPSRSSTPTDGPEFSTMLNATHDELLGYYVKQVQMATVHRQLEMPEEPHQQFMLSKQINDRLALDICATCPGTDLLEKPDLEVLFRYCSFASLWMDSAWINAGKRDEIPCHDRNAAALTNTKEDDETDDQTTLLNFINHFRSTISSELSRLQLNVVEYAALKAFCIWKLAILDSTLTLKIVAQEQYFGVTSALSKYYQNSETMESFEIATRLADITLMLGSIFNIYQDTLKMYKKLGIECSMDVTSL
uniref:NR LBD domain-containing protein n=1 Tax=Caenorhabditis japonica TaxID=281687 RepID=A0A8R1DXJ0_CAEJA